jgi:Ca-activated chloride channel family protein
MGVTSSNKQVSTDRISCGDTLRITLSLTADPDIVSNPTDIVLILDRSGSMAGSPLENLKIGAKTFINLIQNATGGAQTGEIGSGSRIGIVSFAAAAAVAAPLTTSVAELNAAVDDLMAGGATNHAAAFQTATQLFDPLSANAKVMIMFTDGNTTAGAPPAPVAEAAKAQGITIYCIGLSGDQGLDVDALNQWASDPDSTHVALTTDPEELEILFADLAANLSKPGATDIVIDEVVNPDFTITSILSPGKGVATMLNAQAIRWTIPELGVSAEESAELEFLVRHTGQTSGLKQVNASITYADAEGNVVGFPDPTVLVECEDVVVGEECPTPIDVTAEGCESLVEADLGDVYLLSRGRILELSLTLKNVCPGKRTALAVILTEVDAQGLEQPRGMKTLTIPAHSGPGCRDVRVKCLHFVLPEDLDVSGGPVDPLCNQRRFKARVIANSIDSDYRCCESTLDL